MRNEASIGIDIGSTATKVVVMEESQIIHKILLPTGWNCKETASLVEQNLMDLGINLADSKVTATGYGRISVPYAQQTFSEIKCHGLGGKYLFACDNATIIDIGGQDTKVITIQDGTVSDFLMNDKCSAGTGKFMEIMAARLGLEPSEFDDLAEGGQPVTISSMCTVFAESEVIGYIGAGTPRADIVAGIIHSVVEKIANLCNRQGIGAQCFLTGGLSEMNVLKNYLSQSLHKEVRSLPDGRYAGAIGAALCGQGEGRRPMR